MNDLILKHAVECGLLNYVDLETPRRYFAHADIEPEEIERFARNIIQECVDACNSRVGNSDYNTGRMHCISDIKERFRSKQIHDLQRDIRKWKSYDE